MKVNANPFRPFVAGVILMLLILIFEITIKILVGTVGYLLVALFTIWFVHTHGLIILTGFISSLFSLAVLFMPFSDSVPYVTIIVNRIIAIAVIWLAVLFTFRFRKLYHTEHREKQQLKALVEHANEGILLVNREGRIFVANPSAEKIFGYPRGELSGKVINDLIPQRYWKDHTQHFERFTEEPSSRAMGRNLSGIRKDGSEFHVDISLSHFYEGSELTFIAFVLDATDRIRHEELASLNMKIVSSHNQELERKVKQRTLELETTNQELMKSQALYHSMAHNFPDGFIGVMNRNLKYMLVDGKGLPELGLNAKSVLDDRVFDNIHETMTLYAEGAIRKVFDGENVSFDVELNGKYYNVTAVPIGGIDSLINEILVVVKNISGQKTLERELVKTLEKEKELNTLKSRFVTMASHEFRTPLTTILSSAFLLENYTGRQLESEKKKHLERITRSVHGLTELLNDFLSLGKLEEGIVQVVFKPINLRVLGEELL
ncbi:MAG: PAS domain S-box protein, partial [Bacteroidota bacterium]